MSKYYKRALKIFDNGFNARSIALHYAQNYPKAFCDAYDASHEASYVQDCREMMKEEGMKIQAIKHWRDNTGSSLRDAKLAAESLA